MTVLQPIATTIVLYYTICICTYGIDIAVMVSMGITFSIMQRILAHVAIIIMLAICKLVVKPSKSNL